MGVVGQAYVDKETAKKNLADAQQNVKDMEDIIAAAQAQKIVAASVLEKAQAAYQLAQDTAGQLNNKLGEIDQNDVLYDALTELRDDLTANDTDGNSMNGGNIVTAQANIDNINKQITELDDIIAQGNTSLEARRQLVEDLRVAYENAVEVFEGYLPEEDKDIMAGWDEEEDLLRARIQAVIDALAEANLITTAINEASEDIATRAILAIKNVCEKNEATLNSAVTKLYEYLQQLEELKNQYNDLNSRVNQYNSDRANNIKGEILNALESIETNKTSINSKINDVNSESSTNNQIKSQWELNYNIATENFNIDAFDDSISELYSINRSINANTQFLIELKNNVRELENKLARLETLYLYLNPESDVIPVEPEPGPQGEQGEQGGTEPGGEQGNQGEQGEQGGTEPGGEQGNQGEQGEQGGTEPGGEQGEQGEQGGTEPGGEQGNQGEQGEQGGTEPEPTVNYYWYVGHIDPMGLEEIVPLNSNDAAEGAGWRFIGTSLPEYSQMNPLWNGTLIETSENKETQYIAVPSDQIRSYGSFGQDITGEGWIINPTKKTLEGVEYTVWTSIFTQKSFTEILY